MAVLVDVCVRKKDFSVAEKTVWPKQARAKTDVLLKGAGVGLIGVAGLVAPHGLASQALASQALASVGGLQVSVVASPRTRRLNTRSEMLKRRKDHEKKYRASIGVQKQNAEEYLKISRNWV